MRPSHPGDSAASPTGLERLGLWFEAHPEYKSAPSSAWKPYNRDLWFYQTRPIPAGALGGQLRLDVFRRATSLRQSREFERHGGGGWFNIGPTEFSGRCVSIDFAPTDSGIVYVGSAGGWLWKSTNEGDTGSTTTDSLPTHAVGAIFLAVPVMALALPVEHRTDPLARVSPQRPPPVRWVLAITYQHVALPGGTPMNRPTCRSCIKAILL